MIINIILMAEILLLVHLTRMMTKAKWKVRMYKIITEIIKNI